MKIKSKNPAVKGMKLTIPIDGTIEIDANGIANVSDGAAEALVKGTAEWEYLDNKPTTSGEKNKSEEEEMVAGIKSMTLDEMIALANEASYPETEWKKFSKKDKLMAAYLIKKYNEAKLNEESGEETTTTEE